MARDADKKYAAKYLVEQLKISDKYLRRILTVLTKAGIIVSIRGREGGYAFQKKIQEIFLSDIVNATGGMDKYQDCVLGFSECSDETPCVLHSQWVVARTIIINNFLKTSLAAINVKGNIKF
jgi:Rrf2 family protein